MKNENKLMPLMEFIENDTPPFWLLQSSKGRRLLIAMLRIEPESLAGTRFQFLKNNPLISSEIECRLLPRTKAVVSSGYGYRQRRAILNFLKCLISTKNRP